jgi:rubrerythrin
MRLPYPVPQKLHYHFILCILTIEVLYDERLQRQKDSGYDRGGHIEHDGGKARTAARAFFARTQAYKGQEFRKLPHVLQTRPGHTGVAAGQFKPSYNEVLNRNHASGGDLENIRDLLAEMAFNEEKIMELYWLYEKKFPKHELFWRKLADEEKTHANMLKSFAILSGGGEVAADFSGITMKDVRHSIACIKKEIEKAMDADIGPDEAFIAAGEIEKSMLEHKIFLAFSTADRDLKSLIKTLEADTRRHYETVKKLAKNLK